MKVVVAVDSFKGSMTSMEAGMAVKAGILAAKKDAEVIVKPLADGGEGTTDALIEGLKGEQFVYIHWLLQRSMPISMVTKWRSMYH